MKPFIFAAGIALTALSTFVALPAHAQTLRDDAQVTEKLVAAQVGDILRNTCPKASARMFVVLSEMWALKDYAKSQGHSDADIKAFLADTAEKKRIRQLASAYLADAGFVKDDQDSACTIARAEISSGTITGSLLQVSK